MVRLLHFVIVGLYLTLPAAAVVRTVIAQVRRSHASRMGTESTSRSDSGPRFGSLIVTFLCGFLIALSLCLIYAKELKGHVPAKQVLLASYFAVSLLLILRGFDIGLLWILRRLFRVRRPAPIVVTRSESAKRALQSIGVMLIRTAVLVAVGLPFVMAAIMSYRPRVQPKDNPLSQLGFHYERVEFESSDGIKLAGWWIPAAEEISPSRGPNRRLAPPLAGRRDRWAHWGTETAIVCHGLGSSKSNQLILARRLVPGGFNVLIFDLRAHGESGGQVTGYGALEKRDVLAAIKWVRERHAKESEKIFGVGASMGAVALLAAAADDSAEGKSLAAVATYAAYDDLDALARDVTHEFFRPPLAALLQHIGLPAASLHAGVNLSRWAPKELVGQVWPRPILFIHGELDEIIPFERGKTLFDAASQPKYHAWFAQGDHNDVVDNDLAAEMVYEFFRTASPIPVI